MYEQTKEVYTKERKTVYTCRFCKVYSENKLGIFLHEQQCCHNPIYLKMLKDNGLEGHLITDSHGKQYLLKIDIRHRMKPFLVLTIRTENDDRKITIERIPELVVPYRDLIINDETRYYKDINRDTYSCYEPENVRDTLANIMVKFDRYVISSKSFERDLIETPINTGVLEIEYSMLNNKIPNKGKLTIYPVMDHHSPKRLLPLLKPKRNTDAYFKKMTWLDRGDWCMLSMNCEKEWAGGWNSMWSNGYERARDFYIDPECPKYGCRHRIYEAENALYIRKSYYKLRKNYENKDEVDFNKEVMKPTKKSNKTTNEKKE